MSTHDAAHATPSPPTPLARAEAAYATGDFAGVRSEAAAAVRAGADLEAVEKARALAWRVGVDPWCWAALGVSFALFCGIVAAYVR